MPFDTLTMAAVRDEFDATIRGGQIQKIVQPSAFAVALAVYAGGVQHWVVLSADAQHARANLSSHRLAKAFPTPSPFVMLLRKHLEGGRVEAITQTPGERVLSLHCRAGDTTLQLITEIMGKHSNVVLVSAEERILGGLKTVTPRQSRVRPMMPGMAYHPPPFQERSPLFPPGPRLDPCTDLDELSILLAGLPPETLLRDALGGLLLGASPFMVEQIIASAGMQAQGTLGESDLLAVLDAAAELYSLFRTRTWHPCTFKNARGRADYASYAVTGMQDVRDMPGISVAIQETIGEQEARDALGTVRRAVLADTARARAAAARRLASLEEGLAASDRADEIMLQGQMLLAYQHQVPTGTAFFDLPDMGMTISLDPALSASDNAERLFRRYRKLRDARQKLPPLIAEARADVERFDDLAAFAGLAETEADLRAIQHELHPPPEKVRQRKKPRGPARFQRNGLVALAGRNARENEEVTFKVAQRNDLWLHARNRTGAHVVLQGAATDEALEAAAQLAAYLSEGRNDTRVDVDVTEVRNVRKIPGGPPGKVNYTRFRTISVTPSMEGWSRS